MIPEIGHFALILALLLALTTGVLPVIGVQRGIDGWIRLAWPAARAQFAFVAIAFGCLSWSFLINDFSVLYVVENSNSALPAVYRFTAVWGGHEGSLLLWVLLLTLWMVAVTCFSKQLPVTMVATVLGVMSWIASGFLLFMLFTSNPFSRLIPQSMEGRDLNPLLQDPGMVIHPPVLYAGYVGFSVAFAFAIAALLSGRLDAAWARWSRPWTTAAWVFLTLGIMLGSGWAYYELGWGGWWFWDPVENASFMPWLAGTALIHSLAVTEKRGSFRSWTALLAICAFSLSLLGTFLVRSGVITSVHAFASDPTRGVFILGFLALVVGGALLLFAWRAPQIGLGAGFEPVSREALLLSNNVLLMVAAASVLLGTLYPMVLDALGLDKISVGPPYFDSVFVPLMTPAIFLMGVGPLARWKAARVPDLAARLRWAAAVSVVTALALPFTLGSWRPLVSLGLLLATWSFATVAVSMRERIGSQQGRPLLRFRRVPRASYGMWLAHAGIGVFIVGVTLVKGYESERDVPMRRGQTVEVGGYQFRFDGVRDVDGPNYRATRASIAVSREGRPVTTLYPEKRLFLVQKMPMTEAAIDHGVLRDLYVAMGEPIGEEAWTLRIQIKPFVRWIWAGCLLMALGGMLAASDRRYRLFPGRRVLQMNEAARSAGVRPLAANEIRQTGAIGAPGVIAAAPHHPVNEDRG
ncbi:cytochrome c-type biogenesis protein CcmF [Paraburkholderia xenovorans LB400]|uniref:Cytochrome c-type biogenesis protein CcmF n=1 Tax=Paraburkholderia xenovorans (strain LB400) TaxID=266265 RepID=Q13I08_PARXL|nr:heme lyase CcmF/NrfE family subunit [Paraburkholderia xenovorans]ABE36281.1 Cytochrome c-type biogenesis protein CcmF [Paraburkholderia xenovorans LB400]AIP33921.1 cytochrome c-type biogenesis protein CcmF [Paraburkholderia xenovorans LB400]